MFGQHAELALVQRAPDGLFVGRVAVVVLGQPEIGGGAGVVATQFHGRMGREQRGVGPCGIFPAPVCRNMAISVSGRRENVVSIR